MENPLLTLALLACPVGMGLMIWFMNKGNRDQQARAAPAARPDGLRAQQARLEAETMRRSADNEADRRAVDAAVTSASIRGMRSGPTSTAGSRP